MKMPTISHEFTETTQSSQDQTTHPICHDPGATDYRGSWACHLRSHEVTIDFAPVIRERIWPTVSHAVWPNSFSLRR